MLFGDNLGRGNGAVHVVIPNLGANRYSNVVASVTEVNRSGSTWTPVLGAAPIHVQSVAPRDDGLVYVRAWVGWDSPLDIRVTAVNFSAHGHVGAIRTDQRVTAERDFFVQHFPLDSRPWHRYVAAATRVNGDTPVIDADAVQIFSVTPASGNVLVRGKVNSNTPRTIRIMLFGEAR